MICSIRMFKEVIHINNFFWPHNPFNENQREYLFVELFRNVLSKDEYFKQAFISIVQHLYEYDYDVDTGIFREMADKNQDYIEIYVKDQLGLLRTSKIVKRIHSQKEQPCYEIRINRNNEKPRTFFSTFIKPDELSDCFVVWKGLLLCYGISKDGNMEVDTNILTDELCQETHDLASEVENNCFCQETINKYQITNFPD